MTKAQMIQKIIETAKISAIAHGKFCDTTDMFFTLAFTSDANLKKLCKKLGVA
jgi:hypothetical protein